MDYEVLSHMQPASACLNFLTNIRHFWNLILWNLLADNLRNFLPSFGSLFRYHLACNSCLLGNNYSRFLCLFLNNDAGFRCFLAYVERYFFYINTCFFENFRFCKFNVFSNHFRCESEVILGNLEVFVVSVGPGGE